MTKRKIVHIDEDKCTGCGLCVPNCAECAIKIVDGKAKLVSDILCDGLGACLGHCPQGAITIEEREAVPHEHAGCPGSKVMSISRHCEERSDEAISKSKIASGALHPRNDESQLSNWPVQIKLVPTNAPYFKDADILVAADCVPFAYPDFHKKLLKGKILLVGCPKLDDLELYRKKMSEIVKNNDIKSITYVHMEVPCCLGLVRAIEESIAVSGKKVPFIETVVSIKGQIKGR